MDLKDLKNTWHKISSGRELDENQLRQMLEKRTKSLIERIDRNIKIGFFVLFALLLLFILDDFWVSPEMARGITQGVNIPNWLLVVGGFSNGLLVVTFVYFVVKYYRVKRMCNQFCDLRDTLKNMIGTLLLYQRLFYLALFALMLNIGLAFISGIYQGGKMQFENSGATFTDVDTQQLVLVIVVGIAVLALIIGGVFLFLRWGFKRLYGNYIHKLKSTLQELEELGDDETLTDD